MRKLPNRSNIEWDFRAKPEMQEEEASQVARDLDSKVEALLRTTAF